MNKYLVIAAVAVLAVVVALQFDEVRKLMYLAPKPVTA